MNIKIRPEHFNDFPTIYKIVELAFGGNDENELIEAMRKTDDFIAELTFVAVLDNQIIGHIMYSKIQIIGSKNTESIALAPLSVHPNFQKSGIGKQLMEYSISKAKALGFESIIVWGHPEYYPKFGFKPASNWKIKPPIPVPDEVFMGLELKENALQGKSGVVKYGKAFEI